MNFRLTAILVGVMLFVGLVLMLLPSGDDKATSTDLLAEELSLAKPEQIDTVEIEREDGAKLKLVRQGKDRWEEEWDIQTASGKEPVKARADAPTVNELIGALLRAKPTTSNDLTSNAAVHGLQPPSMKVILREGSRSSTINFGDVTIGGNKAVVFVTTSARPSRPLAVSRSSIEPLFRGTGGSGKAVDLAKWADDFRVKSIFGVSPVAAGLDVTALSLSEKGKTLAIKKEGGTWKFVDPANWGDVDQTGDQLAQPGTFTGVNPLLGAVTSLQATNAGDFIDNPSPEDMQAKYGLNPGNPNAIRVELTNKDGEKTIAFIGKKDGGPAPPPGPGVAPTGKVWARVEGQPGVVRATGGDLAGLASVIANPDPMRDRTLLAVDKSRIDGLDIIVGGRTTQLRRAGAIPEWKLYGNPSAGDPQSAAPIVNKLVDLLTERRTIKGFPAPNPANFAPNEVKAEIKVWSNGFEPTTDPKAEPKEKGKPIILTFGKKEGDLVNVRRTMPDGAVNYFTLPDRIKLMPGGETVELLPMVAKTRLDLLDPNLRTFSSEQVSKLTVSGVKNYELVRDEPKDSPAVKDRWTFAAPPDLKGKLADAATVGEMLRLLGTTQSVVRFVDESPTPEKLVEYGLAAPAMPQPNSPPSPRLKVAIELKGVEKEQRTYEFGVTTGEYVYARQTGRTAVFVLPKYMVDKFVDSDLRDREIFQFEPNEVIGLDIEGWGKSGILINLKLEKKDGNWTATEPKQFMLDPKKVNDFLEMLRHTRVKAFIPGTPSSIHGFGDDKEKFIVVVKTAAAPKGLLSLNLGNLTDNGTAYFGWTSVLPQTAPLFTVDAGPFKPYKESSGAFAK
jgi:hypothetical protein